MTTPPETDPESGRIESLDDRFGKIEAEQERQGGILQQILTRLKAPASGAGATDRPAPDAGKTIAELVQEGVERLERDKQAKADADTAAAERADHAERIRQLEEHAPRETASTPAGRFRAGVQKWGFGIDEPRR